MQITPFGVAWMVIAERPGQAPDRRFYAR